MSSDTLPFPYQVAGEYILDISSKDNNGCAQDTSLLISVVPAIQVSIVPDVRDTVVDLGDQILLDFVVDDPTRNIELMTWRGDSIVNPNLKITNVFPLRDGHIDLSIIDEYGCESMDSLFIWVGENYDGIIYIPNAFSPNADGANDVFHIYAKPNTVTLIKTFQIFNRWGEKVFACNDCFPNNPLYGWNGAFNGKEMHPGVFVWRAVIQFIDGEEIPFSGDVTLLR
ncbi:MAG: gliding motility-associated C-terminal domain-containing protein [Bacteroidota bacterium]